MALRESQRKRERSKRKKGSFVLISCVVLSAVKLENNKFSDFYID